MRKTVLVTGCTTGSAGHALAKEYHARGLQVFASARRLESMADLKDTGIELVQLDVTDDASVQAARDLVQSRTHDKSLDLLVNCAGVATTMPALDHDMEDTKKIFETNVFGVMRMVQQFFPLLVKSTDACIMNIGSVVGTFPMPFGSVYNASKAALHLYSDTLRVELRPFNIQVVTVILGGVQSNIFGYPQRNFPEGSLYLPIVSDIRRRRNNYEMSTPVNVFAKQLVSKSLQRYPTQHLWIASGATMIWFVKTFSPLRLLNYFLSRYVGLLNLAKILGDRK